MKQQLLFEKSKSQNINTAPIVINPDVKLISKDNRKVLIVANRPILTYDISDKESERYLIAQLSRNSLATQEELSRYFDISVRTVKNHKRRFLRYGFQGVLYNKPVLDKPRKITPQVIRAILAYYFRHSNASENEIAKQISTKIGFLISQRSVGRVLEQCGFKPKGKKPMSEPFKDLIDDRQRKLVFSPFTKPVESEEQKELSPATYTRADKLYLKQMKKGFFSPYGSSMIYTPIISRFGLLDPYLAIYGNRENKYISSEQIWLTFFHMVFLGFPSIESLKTARGEEFGALIGRNFLPSVRSLRESLAEFSSNAKSENLLFMLCQRFIEHQLASLGLIYIDGHFLPYFGFETTQKAWSSLRRLSLKGNIQYFANDKEQNPLFFVIRPPRIDLIKAIYEMIDLMRKLSDKPLTLIFDRGGFSQDFFIKLRDDYSDIIFITWAKEHSFSIDKQINKLDESLFKLSLLHLKTKKEKVKLAETELSIGKYGPTRAVIILVPGSKKRIAILTNDTNRTKKAIAQAMVNRWGQENFFKLMMKDYHLDYQPGYDTREIELAPMIKNPRYNKISKTIKEINGLITKANAQLGRNTQKKRSRPQLTSRMQMVNQRLVNQINSLKKERSRWKKERDNIPKKISLKEAYLHQNVKELDLEKKAIIDSIKITAYNIQRNLMKVIERSILRKKNTDNISSINTYDIIKQIAGRGARIKLSYNTLYVTIGYFKEKRIQKVAETLCRYLDTLSPVTLGKFSFPIKYQVEKR